MTLKDKLPDRLKCSPLLTMESDSDIETIAESIVNLSDSDGDFFKKTEKLLLMACLGYLRDWCEPSQRTIGNLISLLDAALPKDNETHTTLDNLFYEMKSGCKRVKSEDGITTLWEPSALSRNDGLTPRETNGIDVSEDALRQAIDEHNEICRIITEIGEFRKLENPPITSYEFHVIQLVSECCPQYLVKDMLRETLGEIKTREPAPKPAYRARIVVTGSEVDDPAFTKLLEDCGAYVVADRYCYGSLPGREEIIIRDGESALTAVARHNLSTSECPRYMNKEKQKQRRPNL